MSKNSSSLAPLHGPFIPDPLWERVGYTTHNVPKPLWLSKTQRNRPVPKYHKLDCPICDGSSLVSGESCLRCESTGSVQGDRVWKLHPLTKEPIYKMNEAEHYIHERTFFVESDGMGNQVCIDWRPPSEEEIANQARDHAVEKMVPEISGVLVDSGLSASDIAEALKQLAALGKAVPEVTSVKPKVSQAVAPVVPEPVMAGVGTTTDDPPPEEL